MDSYKLQILQRIEHIEKRPFMYCSTDSYLSMSDLIFGYFLGVDLVAEIELNGKFTAWLNSKKTPQTALIWSGYILHVMAGGDETVACKLLFTELKKFLNEMVEEDR